LQLSKMPAKSNIKTRPAARQAPARSAGRPAPSQSPARSGVRGSPTRPLVLASTSRYRRMLLERLGPPFETVAPQIDETPLANEAPAATAFRLAAAKARSVASGYRDALIIGSDQVADCAGQAIGKPGTHENAAAQLRALSGQTVVFHTGLALLDVATGKCQTAIVDVRSTYRHLTSDEI